MKVNLTKKQISTIEHALDILLSDYEYSDAEEKIIKEVDSVRKELRKAEEEQNEMLNLVIRK